MNNDYKQKIIHVMETVFEIPTGSLDENASIDSVENWDSLKHLTLILALEEEFNISIPDEEVGNLVNFKIIDIIINEQLR